MNSPFTGNKTEVKKMKNEKQNKQRKEEEKVAEKLFKETRLYFT